MPLAYQIRGGSVLIDEEDYPLISKYKWYVLKDTGYARADYGKRRYILMHHLIKGKPVPPLVTDHIDRDKLNNTKNNLRFISQRDNGLNANRPCKGYYFRKERNAWQVRFNVNGKLKYYGLYSCEDEAINVANSVKEQMRACL